MYTVDLGNGSIGFFPGPCFAAKDILERYRLRFDKKDGLYHVDNGCIEVFANKDLTMCENWIMLSNIYDSYKEKIGRRLIELRSKLIEEDRKYAHLDNDLTRYADGKSPYSIFEKHPDQIEKRKQYERNREKLQIWDKDIFAFEEDYPYVTDFSYINETNTSKRQGPPLAGESFSRFDRFYSDQNSENDSTTPSTTQTKPVDPTLEEKQQQFLTRYMSGLLG